MDLTDTDTDDEASEGSEDSVLTLEMFMIFPLDEELVVLDKTGAGGNGNIVAADGVLLDTGDTDIEEEIFSCNVIFLVVDVKHPNLHVNLRSFRSHLRSF